MVPHATAAPPDAVPPNPIRSTGQIRALLADLGGTADAIARTLHTAGITGDPGEPCACPVARYLTAHADVTRVEVTETEVIADLPDGRSVTVFTPRPVTEFITGFDLGHYPHLIAREVR